MDVGEENGRGQTFSVNGGVNNFSRVKYAGSGSDYHEVGHMLGFVDRYDDYVNSKDASDVRSINHEGYKNSIMAAGRNKELNQSHYDAVVKFTNFMLTTAQRHLSDENKSTNARLKGTVDAYIKTYVNPADVPAGFIKK